MNKKQENSYKTIGEVAKILNLINITLSVKDSFILITSKIPPKFLSTQIADLLS